MGVEYRNAYWTCLVAMRKKRLPMWRGCEDHHDYEGSETNPWQNHSVVVPVPGKMMGP